MCIRDRRSSRDDLTLNNARPTRHRGCRDTRSRTRSLWHVALATASPEIDRHTTDVHRSVRDADRHGQAAPADQVRLSPAERSGYGTTKSIFVPGRNGLRAYP